MWPNPSFIIAYVKCHLTKAVEERDCGQVLCCLLFLCSCVAVRYLSCCCFYFFVVLYLVVATLAVGLCIMTYVIFATLVVRSWTLMYNYFGFLPSRLSGSFSSF